MSVVTTADDDFFRPKQELEASIYDAIQDECINKISSTIEQKLKRIRFAALRVATAYAKANRLHVPTIREIKHIEKMALRHLDFQIKYSIYLADCMRKKMKRRHKCVYCD